MLARLFAQLVVLAVWLRWRPRRMRRLDVWVLVVVVVGVLVVLVQYGRYRNPLLFRRLQDAVPRVPPLILLGLVLVLGFLFVVIAGYFFRWRWTGFVDYTYPKPGDKEVYHGKKLWDWLQLLVIPVVLAAIALLFNYQNARTQQEIANDNQREASLQSYFDKMSELILDRNLRTSTPDSEVRSVARTRTLSALSRIDGNRKGALLQFLQESQLISKTDTIIHLNNADLQGAILNIDLHGADLTEANLQDAHLSGADLTDAMLSGADLGRAELIGVSLRGTNLQGASLSGAKFVKFFYPFLVRSHLIGINLRDADLSEADLRFADLRRADLAGGYLYDTDLRNADLSNADLTDTELEGAVLDDANLTATKVTKEQLATCRSLKGTIMPDGSKHN